MKISLDGVFNALAAPIALIDSPDRQAEIKRFVEAARVHQERAIFELFSEIVSEINETGLGARVRLEYQSGALHLTVDPEGDADDEYGVSAGAELERLTLRLPTPLKRMVDEAAAARGISANSWCIRALGRAGRKQEHGHHDSDEHQHDRRRRDRGSRGPSALQDGQQS